VNVLCAKENDFTAKYRLLHNLPIHFQRQTPVNLSPGLLNRLPDSAGGIGGKVTAAGWQVTLRDPMWHVISHSGLVPLRTAKSALLYLHAAAKTTAQEC